MSSTRANESKVVVVFGSFDGLHDGHRHFLREAKKLGDNLVAVVAQDAYIRAFKNRAPRFSLQERMDALKVENLADEIIAGDYAQNSWAVLQQVRPHIIALGYDQQTLQSALEEHIKSQDHPIQLSIILSHQPDVLHSSILFG